MNTIYIYNNTNPNNINYVLIELNKISNLSIFDNINCIITDNELDTNNFVINNFDVIKTEIIHSNCEFVLNKKMIKINLKNNSSTNNVTLLIEENLFRNIGYFACLLDYEEKNVYDIFIPDYLYNNSVSEIITYLNEPKTNYLSIPNDILTRNFNSKNPKPILETITKNTIIDLFQIEEPTFLRYMLFYFFYRADDFSESIRFKNSCECARCTFYSRKSYNNHDCQYNYKDFTVNHISVYDNKSEFTVFYKNEVLLTKNSDYSIEYNDDLIHVTCKDKSECFYKFNNNGKLENIPLFKNHDNISYKFFGKYMDMYLYQSVADHENILLAFGINYEEYLTYDCVDYGDILSHHKIYLYIDFAKKILKLE